MPTTPPGSKPRGETDLDLAVFPEACPYDFDAIMTRPIEWPAATS